MARNVGSTPVAPPPGMTNVTGLLPCGLPHRVSTLLAATGVRASPPGRRAGWGAEKGPRREGGARRVSIDTQGSPIWREVRSATEGEPRPYPIAFARIFAAI